MDNPLSFLVDALRGDAPTVPDGYGGYVPATNSRINPQDGSFLSSPSIQGAIGTAAKSPGFMQMLAGALSGTPPPPPPSIPVPQASLGPSPVPSPQAPAATVPIPQAMPSPALGPHTVPEGQQASPSTAPDVSAAAPTEAQDPTSAAYRDMHDKSVTAYHQALDMARRTAGTPASAAYLKIAEDASKTADAINLKAIEYAKPEARPQTISEGQGVLNPSTGKYDVPLPKTTKEPEAPTSVKEYEYAKKNGYAGTYNDFHMEKTNASKQTESILGVNGQPIDESSVEGPAVLSVVPPEVARMSQAMIEGRSPIPNLSVRTDPVTRQAVMVAQKADPSLNVGNPTARVKVLNEFLAGGLSSPASRMTAGNNAINHIDEANYYAQQLHDLGYDSLNAAANAVTSGSSPVGLALKGYNTAVNNFAGEIVKFNTGGEGALEDRREKAALFSQNLTAGERKTAMEAQIGILMSNMESLQKRWRDGMGPLVPDFETIHPNSKQAIERIKGNLAYPPPGGLPPSMRGEQPQAPAQSQVNAAEPAQHMSPEEAMKLPPGTPFIGTDGIQRVRH